MSKEININRYLLSELYPHAKYTAGILREDIETVLERSGYKKIKYPEGADGFLNRLLSYPALRKTAKQLETPAVVFFHFPVRSRVNRYFFSALKKRGIKTIAYVHDFEGIRDLDPALLHDELRQLSAFDIIIAQNMVMKEMIETETGNKQVIELGMYDHLDTSIPEVNPSKNGAIVFAGNLFKAPFVNQLDKLPGINFHIYGEMAPAIAAPNIVYKGKKDPRELPSVLAREGSWGLVWDGSSLDSGKDAGAYLRINTPHKLALYVMAGLPVIVWNESAMANWVLENKIGIAVGSLNDLPTRLAGITTEEYLSFQNHLIPVRQKISEGYYLDKALQNAKRWL